MNPNDIIAQQQAMLNQTMQHAQEVQLACLIIGAAMFIFGIFVVYLFYARFRDIADELRKLRIAFEFAEDRKARAAKPTPPRASGESPYLPKSS
jgi:hypothetical protein